MNNLSRSCGALLRPAVFRLHCHMSSVAETTTGGTTSHTESAIDMDQFVDSIGLDVKEKNKGKSFARLLRESKLMQLGDIDGRVVVGKIVHRFQDDLYIDVGLKFNAVCKAPAVDGESYRVGSQVLARLHDAELSERFLGSRRDLTLLEADATLLRLIRGAGQRATKQRKGDKSSQKPASDEKEKTDIETA